MHKAMIVNVIMPVYNEARTLREIVGRVLKQPVVDRLIIVDDHSADGSLDIARAVARRDSRITVIPSMENRGKGHAVHQGIHAVKSGVIIVQDADTEYFPEDYPKLLAEMDGKHVVFGTRMTKLHSGHTYQTAKLANTIMTWIFNLMYGQRITDMNTCYKVFTKEMIGRTVLRQDRFLGDAELAITLARKGYRIREVPIHYRGRTYAEGKKIRASDGIAMTLYIIAERFR